MLSASEMRMVGCFMAMHRDIFLKGSLQATVVGGRLHFSQVKVI
jgi:hypothetical protein